MSKIRLTPKQKEALSYTPLHLGFSEFDLNHSSWGTNWQRKWFTNKTVYSLVDKGLLEHPRSKGRRGYGEPDNTEVVLTEKAIEMGFVENMESKENEHTIAKKEPKENKIREPGTRKPGKLYKELDVLLEVAKKMEFKQAEDLLQQLIYD